MSKLLHSVMLGEEKKGKERGKRAAEEGIKSNLYPHKSLIK